MSWQGLEGLSYEEHVRLENTVSWFKSRFNPVARLSDPDYHVSN
jgi:hypothetical protein